MLAGVTIVDPASTWIDAGVEIEQDVTIHPFTVIRGEVRIASGVEIGPFASIRTRTELGPNAKVGTFVELKAASVGARHEDPAPQLHRRRRDRRGHEHRRRERHRELQPHPRPAEETNDDRQQRQDRRRQYVPRTRRDRGRHVDCAGDGHHGECVTGLARRVRAAPDHEGRVGVREAWKPRQRLTSPFPASRGAS